MKVYVHGPNENWIVDRFTDEFRTYCSDISVNNPYEADIIWLIADWCYDQLPYDLLKKKKVFTTNFHIVPEKFNSNSIIEFMKRDKITDLYHSSCNKTEKYLKDIGATKPIWTGLTWVNGNLWKRLENKKEIRREFGIHDDEFVIGSFQRDTEGHDLKSPKLEKGPDIFCDYVEKVAKDKKVVVLLGGWRREYVMNRLKYSNIRFIYSKLPNFETLNKMYNALDLYVVGSRYEGGPQSILECAVIEIPIISTDVGVASHILSHESISKEISAESLLECIPNIDYAKNKVQELLIPQGFNIFREKLKELL
jgi:glycosyltransferase involved in cell wall biosynthesis